jgi:nanoRNase/pAp phosphatase (c-di-AMP/oligoRNAs hydrolase)
MLDANAHVFYYEAGAPAALSGVMCRLLNGVRGIFTSLDDTALQHLFPIVNKDALAKIRNAPMPESFFEALLQALQSSFIYDDRLLISWINDLPMPELAAQVCDFLVRYENISWAVCAGVHDDTMILSARTAHLGEEAGEVLRQVVSRMGGKAGGHDRRAGGYIPLPSTSASAIEQVQSDFRRRLLKALQIDEFRGRIFQKFLEL